MDYYLQNVNVNFLLLIGLSDVFYSSAARQHVIMTTGVTSVPRVVPPLVTSHNMPFTVVGPTMSSTALHPTSPGATTAVYRGFAPLRDHRAAPYPTHFSRYAPPPGQPSTYQSVSSQ